MQQTSRTVEHHLHILLGRLQFGIQVQVGRPDQVAHLAHEFESAQHYLVLTLVLLEQVLEVADEGLELGSAEDILDLLVVQQDEQTVECLQGLVDQLVVVQTQTVDQYLGQGFRLEQVDHELTLQGQENDQLGYHVLQLGNVSFVEGDEVVYDAEVG